MLPDILSSLSANPEVATPKFRAIMAHLLTLVSKDKHMDALVEKMCHRSLQCQKPSPSPQPLPYQPLLTPKGAGWVWPP